MPMVLLMLDLYMILALGIDLKLLDQWVLLPMLLALLLVLLAMALLLLSKLKYNRLDQDQDQKRLDHPLNQL